MSEPALTVNNEAVLKAIISHFLNLGAKAEADSHWLIGILPADLLEFLRSEFTAAIRQKAAGDSKKARKIFLALGKTGRAIYGSEFARVKKALDAESRAAVRKMDAAGSVR